LQLLHRPSAQQRRQLLRAAAAVVLVLPVKALTVVNARVKGEVDHGVQLAVELLHLGT
jgi:hypothetical protein